jgi:predicted metal-binding protein
MLLDLISLCMIQRPAKLCRYTSPEQVKQAMSYAEVEIKGSIHAVQYL